MPTTQECHDSACRRPWASFYQGVARVWAWSWPGASNQKSTRKGFGSVTPASSRALSPTSFLPRPPSPTPPRGQTSVEVGRMSLLCCGSVNGEPELLVAFDCFWAVRLGHAMLAPLFACSVCPNVRRSRCRNAGRAASRTTRALYTNATNDVIPPAVDRKRNKQPAGQATRPYFTLSPLALLVPRLP
jgi:hypothetical protein